MMDAPTVMLDSMVRVKKEALTFRQLRKIRRSLRIRVESGAQDDPEEIRKAYWEEDGYMCLPRQWRLSRRILQRNSFLDRRSEGTPIGLKFHSEKGWRKGQEKFFTDIIEGLEDDELGGIGKAGCGFGKTVIGCATMAKLDVTTLVLVHTEPIRNQWVESCKKFLGIEPGIIQGDRCDYDGYPISIAMIHSLAARDDYPSDLYKWPGLVIADECHHMAARTFWGVITRFPAKHYLGFSATPRRRDGLEDIFFWTIGDILAEGKGDELDCRVWKYLYWPDIDWNDIKDRRGRPSYTKFLQELAEDPDRTSLLCRTAAKAAMSGRKVLVLTKTLDHIAYMLEEIKEIFEEQGLELTVGHYRSGKTKKIMAEKAAAARADVCLATDKLGKEGLDIEELDTLVLAMPMGDVEQAAGRIRRLLTGKKEPHIVIIQDQHQFAKNLNEEQDDYFKNEKWAVHEIDTSDRRFRGF